MAENTLNQEFKLGNFEGPLDLLLFLIKKSEINIYDIPITKIIEQYLDYLNYATRNDLENLTEFYLMASTLLYIKSRMLLPIDNDIDEEVEDPRIDLVKKLIEYQKYKKLGELIQDKESEWTIEKNKAQRILPFQDNEIWEEINVWDLLRTFSSIISSISSEKIIDLYEEVSVNEKITLINEILESKKELSFSNLILNKGSIMELICAFLAVLELVKTKQLTIFQNKLFGDIRIRERDRNGI